MTRSARDEYDRLAPVYDRRWSSYTEASLRATLEGLDLAEGTRVLDLASGTGELASRLRALRPGVTVVGADLSAAMLRRGLAKIAPGAWLPVQAEAARLPFAARSFGAVVCTSAFHMFPQPEAALAEVRRVLQPGGMLTLTDWCDDFLACKLCSLYLRLAGSAPHRVYGLRDCLDLVRGAGFEVLGARRFRINWPWGLMRVVAR